MSRGVPDGFKEILFNSGISWCWESGGREIPQCKKFERPPSILTENNFQAFLGDIEADDDVTGMLDVCLYGVDAGRESCVIGSEYYLKKSMEQFATLEAGPIRIFFLNLDDTPESFVFVPHAPIRPVQEMLEAWNVRPSNLKKHRYGLGMPRIEYCFNLG
jgi:hypothetical protein